MCYASTFLEPPFSLASVKPSRSCSYTTCRSLKAPACFSGFWIDLSSVSIGADTPHTLAIKLPSMAPGAFGGVYYDNVDTVYAALA